MLNVLLVVWRECFEIILIVGILFTYLKRNHAGARPMGYMWAGAVLGLALSFAFAYLIQHVESELQGVALDFFEVGMLVTAAVLMTHMCLWMKQHSKSLRREVEGSLSVQMSQSKVLGIAGLALIAVLREGAEIVLFLKGILLEGAATHQSSLLITSFVLGLFLSVCTAFAFYRGLKIFNPKIFFRLTTLFLFVTASTLILTAVRKLIQMDVVHVLLDTAWDSSAALDERSAVGQFVSTLTGYESTPAVLTVLIYAIYWLVSLGLYAGLPTFWRRQTSN